jgi:hypothetical protein
MVEFVYVNFDETTNIGVKNDNSIIGDGAKNINAINESQAIII